jgi:hypothetical protein
MKILANLCITVALVFLFSCTEKASVVQHEQKDGSQVECKERVYDFGIAATGQKITHMFECVNKGKRPVQIVKVSTSCGCTAVLLAEKVVPPGSQCKIRAVMDTISYEGKQEETITIHFNDAAIPEAVLTMRGMIKTGIAVVPEGIYFGNVKNGQALTKRVQVLQLSQSPLILKQIDTNEKYFVIKTARFREENKIGINLEITLKPDLPLGQLNEVITLHTNLKEYPRIDVPVWANVLE